MYVSAKPSMRAKTREPLVYCVAMVRNEADIINIFLTQALSLFDKAFLVDVQSTDGTREIIDAFAADAAGRIVCFSCRTQERYQAALLNTLARKAFSEGADWVFPLDADEFLDVASREALVDRLAAADEDLLFLPWVNLVPSRFGDFESFAANQTFSSLEQPSAVNKVAISARYALVYPDFCLEEGSHNVSRTVNGRPEVVRPSLPLLHLPIRSAARLKYKTVAASRLLASKHSAEAEEGHHVGAMLRRLDAEAPTPDMLASLIQSYGLKDDGEPSAAAKPPAKPPAARPPSLVERLLPPFAREAPVLAGEARSLKETLERDRDTQWRAARFGRGVPVAAEINGADIDIRCRPALARGAAFYGRYEALGAEPPDDGAALDVKTLTDTVAAALGDFPFKTSSDWSGLHPALFAVMSLLRPRRYVGLGVHDGTSFFAACQAAETLKIETQCVAVDAWIDHDDVFDRFRRRLGDSFPEQHIVRGSFTRAVECFDDGSIDLLQIDGYHSFGATADDFTAWLPKMSRRGTVLFHDIAVFRRESGVWRLWDTLKARYPACAFHHSNGLGILYLGEQDHVLRQAIDLLRARPDIATLAQLVFAGLGERDSQGLLAVARRIDPLSDGAAEENARKLAAVLRSARTARAFKRALGRSLWMTRAKYWLAYSSSEKRRRYATRKRELKDAIAVLDWTFGTRKRQKPKALMEPTEPQMKSAENVVFDRRQVAPRSMTGLHPKVRLVIPTRGCAKWLPYFLDAYRAWGLEPTYAVDHGSEPETLKLLKDNNVRTIFIDSDQIPNGESIMPFLSKSIEEDYIFRLDDDEFPARELIDWVNSIPDSKYAFVSSWWIPRYEVALIDGKLSSCHPKWLRTKVGPAIVENLHGGRFYRHKDVTYDKVGPHHGNFISDYVSHAPPEALLIHLDYLVRTMEERLGKIRSTEKRFPNAGWPFANHMLPEMAPRALLRPKEFKDSRLQPLIDELIAKVYRPTDKLVLGVEELIALQQDRLDIDSMHFHY